MNWSLQTIGRIIVRNLAQPARGYEPFIPSNPDVLRGLLRPGDILLVEGNHQISDSINLVPCCALCWPN